MNRIDETFNLLVPRDRAESQGARFKIRPLLRYKWTVVLFTLAAVAAGLLYVAQRPPRYTAEARLVVENIRLDASRQELVPATASVDASLVDSQVEIFKAQALALKTIESLGLAKDPEFAGLATSKGWAASIVEALPWLSYVLPVETKAPAQHNAAIAQAFQNNLGVKRIGQSTVIGVAYTSEDPEKSAQITNELIRQYLDDQVSSAAAYSNSVSAWLRDRVKDIGPKTRVVSWASPPSQKEGPRALLLLGAFMGIGTLLGTGAALARTISDARLREPATAAVKIGGEFLGAAPVLRRGRRTAAPKPGDSKRMPQIPMFEKAVVFPRSDFAHLIKGIRAALSRRRTGAQVIGVTSTISGEGTTTIAANLAHSAAAGGDRVLLIDANIYKPVLSTKLAPGATKGLVDVVAGRATLAEVIVPADGGPLHVVPRGTSADSGQLFDCGSQIETLVSDWAKSYDLIVFDLPPTIPVSDVAFAPLFVDIFLLVVQWGKIPAPLAERGLADAGINGKNLLGFVFNKVKSSQLSRAAFPTESFRRHNKPTAYVNDIASGRRLEPGDAVVQRVERGLTNDRGKQPASIRLSAS